MTRIAPTICLFWISTLTIYGTGENPQEKVSDLWDKMIEAKGVIGSPIRTFVLSLKATSGSAFKSDNAGMERRTIVSSPPDEWWTFNDFRPGKLGATVSVYDLASGKAWLKDIDNDNPPQSTNPNTPGERQSRELILAAFFCQAPGFSPKLMEARHRVREGFHTYDVVTASWDDELIYYLDPITHLPEKLEIVIKGNTAVPAYRERSVKTISYSNITSIVMEGYHEMGGLKVPGRVKIKDSWYDVSAKINLDLRSEFFRNPPIGVTSEDDWKR